MLDDAPPPRRGGFAPAFEDPPVNSGLPYLEKDPFGWTADELADAVRTARRWLFAPPTPKKEV